MKNNFIDNIIIFTEVSEYLNLEEIMLISILNKTTYEATKKNLIIQNKLLRAKTSHQQKKIRVRE